MRWLQKRKETQHEYLVKTIGIGLPAAHKAGLGERPGDDRICDPRRSSSGNRDHRNRSIQAAAAGALERYRRGDCRSVKGQSTVEFAVVTAGFLAATVALGALWRTFADGLLVEHALAVTPVNLVDIFLF